MNDSLGDRMKENYEDRSRYYLTRRTPVIIRLDGRAFHTLTRNMAKPFDRWFIQAMVESAEYVFRNMQGCKMAYVQSDEASFVLTDYDELNTDAWFGYCKSKIESIAASMMTAAFCVPLNAYAAFDARSFNIPESEVANYFLWRAKDWHRNSVQMYAQSFFSPKELHGKKLPDIHEMLHAIGKNWATDLSPVEKNGTFLVSWTKSETVEPRYDQIAAIWNNVKPKETV